jgi:hypothetical protein
MFADPIHHLVARGFPQLQTIVHESLHEPVGIPGPSSSRKLARAFPDSGRQLIPYHLGLR